MDGIIAHKQAISPPPPLHTHKHSEQLEYRRPTFKCEYVSNANAIFPPDSQLLDTQTTYYARITYVIRNN